VNFQNISKNSSTTRLRKNIGEFGEQMASDFLIRKGYSILVRNFCVRGGEIDIIARCDADLIVIEVKTRTSTVYGFGEEAVDKRKQKRIKIALASYVAPFSVRYVRFDIIAIDLDRGRKSATIRHLKNSLFD